MFGYARQGDGGRQSIFDLRKAAVNIPRPLAQRYLTTDRTLYLCIENLTGKECRWCNKGIPGSEEDKKDEIAWFRFYIKGENILEIQVKPSNLHDRFKGLKVVF